MSEFAWYFFSILFGVVLLFFFLLSFALNKEKDWLVSLSVGVILITLGLMALGSLSVLNKDALDKYLNGTAVGSIDSNQDDMKRVLEDKDLIDNSLGDNSLDYDEVKALLRAGEVLNIYGVEEKITNFEKTGGNVEKAKLEFSIEEILDRLDKETDR